MSRSYKRRVVLVKMEVFVHSTLAQDVGDLIASRLRGNLRSFSIINFTCRPREEELDPTWLGEES